MVNVFLQSFMVILMSVARLVSKLRRPQQRGLMTFNVDVTTQFHKFPKQGCEGDCAFALGARVRSSLASTHDACIIKQGLDIFYG